MKAATLVHCNCSEHNATICTDWIDVLDEELLDELLEICPESCNVVECMWAELQSTSITMATPSNSLAFYCQSRNATEARLFHSPSAATKPSLHLDESSGKDASSNSTATAVMWTFGLLSILLFSFLLSRRSRGNSNECRGTPCH